MNRAQALSKLNRSDMRNAAAERGTQRIFAWNRAHWIGMVVLIAVLLLLQWSSSMYLMPDEVLDRRNHRTAGIRLYQSSLTAGVPIPFLGSVVEANAR